MHVILDIVNEFSKKMNQKTTWWNKRDIREARREKDLESKDQSTNIIGRTNLNNIIINKYHRRVDKDEDVILSIICLL